MVGLVLVEEKNHTVVIMKMGNDYGFNETCNHFSSTSYIMGNHISIRELQSDPGITLTFYWESLFLRK